MKTVIVIGGGAAGMIAAGRAAETGSNVKLYEKNDKLGKKLSITGKGRCNITNASDVNGLMSNICGNPRFLYSAINGFDSFSAVNFFNNLGLDTKIERGNRVFPVSDNAADVVSALEKYLIKNRVQVILNAAVTEIKIDGENIAGVVANGNFSAADSVIIATGGLSYPGTGSTGDGYGFARRLGHGLTDLYPSLVPLEVKEPWVKDLQGLSLKNIEITMREGGKLLYSDFGEMLFTHYGISGPVILSASRYALGKYDKNITINIDLKPALSHDQLDKRILRDFGKYINRAFKNSLSELLPKKLIPVMITLSDIDPDKAVNDITRSERKKLAELIKCLTVTITGARGFNEAVITVGGINVNEINPKTMESRIVKGLYFCGEVLDVDAYTGGFNLQIAFSTGWSAGNNA